MHKELGKIMSVRFGFGGYQDAQFGIWFEFGNSGWGVGNGKGFWTCEWTENTKWTEEERIKFFGELVMEISKWMGQAKVSDVSQLKGIPVEITFDHPYGKLESWRILTEVL